MSNVSSPTNPALPADADKRATRQDPCGGSWVTGRPTAMAIKRRPSVRGREMRKHDTKVAGIPKSVCYTTINMS
jgi:hypothetical protein